MNLTQSLITKGSGVHQSQVSRILSGDFIRYSTNVDKLCKYAKLSIEKDCARPLENKRIVDALNVVWDGTDEHAEDIAQILHAVGRLRRTRHEKISLK